MKSWMTVILLYPDYMSDTYGADIYVGWALVPLDASDGHKGLEIACKLAVDLVREDAERANPVHPDCGADFQALAVFRGRHEAIADSTWAL